MIVNPLRLLTQKQPCYFPQTLHAGFCSSEIDENRMASPSKRRSFPAVTAPSPVTNFIASIACRVPMTPGVTPAIGMGFLLLFLGRKHDRHGV